MEENIQVSPGPQVPQSNIVSHSQSVDAKVMAKSNYIDNRKAIFVKEYENSSCLISDLLDIGSSVKGHESVRSKCLQSMNSNHESLSDVEYVTIKIKRLADRKKLTTVQSEVSKQNGEDLDNICDTDACLSEQTEPKLTRTDRNVQEQNRQLSIETTIQRYGLVVHAIYEDGNCMFSAVVDQLRIAGNCRFSNSTLRAAAVDYMRDHPYQRDGSHLGSFLFDESWEDYLCRMIQDGEWGDHVILNGITEVIGRHITVLSASGNVTHLSPQHATISDDQSLDTVYIGHVSDNHYVSLRPYDWKKIWPINAMIVRMTKTLESNQLSLNVEELTEDTVTCDPLTATKSLIDLPRTDNIRVTSPSPWDPTRVSHPYTRNLSGILQFLSTDIHYIDPISRIPVMYLSYILRQVLHIDFFNKEDKGIVYLERKDSRELVDIGSYSEGLNVHLMNFNKTQHKDICREYSKQVYFLAPDEYKIVTNESELLCLYHDRLSMPLLIETEKTHTGYLRLRTTESNHFRKVYRNTKTVEDKYYICFLPLILTYNDSKLEMLHKYVTGVKCGWPDQAREWITRARPLQWPKNDAIEKIHKLGCYIVHQHHAHSPDTEIEFQFLFSQAEKLLMQDEMTYDMKYCFYIFKAMVKFQTTNRGFEFPTYFIKTILFYACESIPLNTWRNSCGSCVLFMIELLLQCIRRGNLPNYFINLNNMIDHWKANDLKRICEQIDALRRFPCMVLYFLCQGNGLPTWVIDSVMASSKIYKAETDVEWVITNTFNPVTFQILKCFITRPNEYKHLYRELIEAFGDNVAWSGKSSDFRSFRDEFLLTVNNNNAERSFVEFFEAQFNTESSGTLQTLGELLGPEYTGKYRNELVKISSDSWLPVYLFLSSLFDKDQYQDVIDILQCLIEKYKQDMNKFIVDVSEIDDRELKKQIAKSNHDTTIKHLPNIVKSYNTLCVCYYRLRQDDQLYDVIFEFQDLVEKMPTRLFISNLVVFWRSLGRPEKAKETEEYWKDFFEKTDDQIN